MSSGGSSKKFGGQSKMKKSATRNAKPVINPAAQSDYPVEKITGKRYWNGRPEVLVQWEGYPPEESTWEPMEHVGASIELLADFEAELYKRGEQKKCLQIVLDQIVANSPASSASTSPVSSPGKQPAPMERRLEIGQSTALRAYASNSVIPKPNAGHKMGNGKENPLVKTPLMERLTTSMQKSVFNDNKDLLLAPSSLGKRAHHHDDWEIITISSEASEPSKSPGSGRQPGPWQTKAEKKDFEPYGWQQDPIDQALKIIHSSPPKTRQVKNRVQESSKKTKEKTSKKREYESSDLDSDSSDPNSKCWKMPLRKKPFGLARGLELEEVVHNFKVRDTMFMFVHWEGCKEMDAVPLDDLRLVYPDQVIQYFEKEEKERR